MEEKLLKIIQLADSLNQKQNKVFAEINYIANDARTLEIIIRSKKDLSHIERCEVNIYKNSEKRWDKIIELFESYVGGVKNE